MRCESSATLAPSQSPPKTFLDDPGPHLFEPLTVPRCILPSADIMTLDCMSSMRAPQVLYETDK
jgi:hypothetical protein